MYKIFADNTCIYDSTLDEYKIGTGSINLETNKSGSFTFSVYPDHFFYDNFVKLKTVIMVLKDQKIIFRGRVLNDTIDYHNNKVLTCEGELGLLQDSIIRPFNFSGTPTELFEKFINEHNIQVGAFKRFKIGTVTVVDPNDYITRSNSNYETALNNLNSRLIEDSLGGYFYITHGDDGTDPIPTINYLADFTNVSTQTIRFGENLKDFVKTSKGEEIATAIIPLGYTIDDGDSDTEDKRLTITSVNNGVDYIYSDSAVSLRDWIFKPVIWDDVTDAANLKSKGEAYLTNVINQNITIELNAIDLHLLDKSIESFKVCDYIHVISEPHYFDSILLCNKQTIDLLKPENDSVVLGYTYSTFTEINGKISNRISNIVNIQSRVNNISNRLIVLNQSVNNVSQDANNALENYKTISNELNTVNGDLEAIATAVTDNARNIVVNANNISKNANDISILTNKVESLESNGDTGTIVDHTHGNLNALNQLSIVDSKLNLTNSNGIVLDGDVYGNVVGLSKLKAFPNNANLNDYTTPGAWAIRSNVVAETMTNLPIQKAGRIIIYNSCGGPDNDDGYIYLCQEYTPVAENWGPYRRYVTREGGPGTAWTYGAWKRIASTITPVDYSLTVSSTPTTYKYTGISYTIPANTVACLTVHGMYNNSGCREIGVANSSTNAASVIAHSAYSSNGACGVAVNIVTSSTAKTIYFWGKWAAATSNPIHVKGIQFRV